MNTRKKFAELQEEQDSIVESVVSSFKQAFLCWYKEIQQDNG